MNKKINGRYIKRKSYNSELPRSEVAVSSYFITDTCDADHVSKHVPWPLSEPAVSKITGPSLIKGVGTVRSQMYRNWGGGGVVTKVSQRININKTPKQ